MTRIEETKKYLVDLLIELNENFKVVNVNFLSNEIGNYSLDKIPTKSKIEETITGKKLMKDVYNFRSKKSYGSSVATNLSNMGFWEAFEDKIYFNNEQGILPNIDGIISIQCLNCGSIQKAGTQDCEMAIQIQVEYEDDKKIFSI